MPVATSGTLRTPPAVQHDVVARRSAGQTKRKISRELGIARKTVDAILSGSPVEEPDYAIRIHKTIVPSALDRVTQAIQNEKDTDAAKFILQHTVFDVVKAPQYTVNGDMHLQQTMTLLPPATPTEAAAKAPPGDIGLSNHTNFSP